MATATIPSSIASNLSDIDLIRKKMSPRRMLQLPFFVHIAKNQLTASQLRVFFTQYYCIVRTSFRMLAAGILSTPPEDVFTTEHQVRFLATEAGGNPTHLGYYLRWAEAFGVTTSDLVATQFNEKSTAFENVLMTIYSSSNSFDKLVAQLATEDCAAVLIEGLNEGFRTYRLNARAYGYLAAHLLLENDEDGHSRWAIDALGQCSDLTNRLSDVETTYIRVYDAFAGVFEGVFEDWETSKIDHVHSSLPAGPVGESRQL